MDKDILQNLYKKPISSTRGGPLYMAFSYPTKISPEAIALFIATHTEPGDTVFDGFSGSGTTGLATLMCAFPTKELKEEARRLQLPVKWGARKAILYEIGTLGAFVSNNLCNPPDSKLFKKAANEILKKINESHGWMYSAKDPDGNIGQIRHIVWSDVIICPNCSKKSLFWDDAVEVKPAKILAKFKCNACNKEVALSNAKRLTKLFHDSLTGQKKRQKVRKVAWVYGTTKGLNWSRPATKDDAELFKKIEATKMPASAPIAEIKWGDLHRKGYHEGIKHLHDFYTIRNFAVMSALWEIISKYPDNLKDALKFWILSYNASHSTLMTRVVAKTDQADLVVTGAQSGVLYVSGLPVEKNILTGLRRKLNVIDRAFNAVHRIPGAVEVVQGSCTNINLENESVDYIFTDPPFGGYIPYSEINFINEAWLGRLTETADEVIINKAQKKKLVDYQDMMSKAFSEFSRILKKNKNATIIFNSAESGVWSALKNAYQSAGFQVKVTSILNKTQGSFKQVTASGGVSSDPIILLSKTENIKDEAPKCVWKVTESLIKSANRDINSIEKTPQRLYSRLVNHYISHHNVVPIDAITFYKQLSERYPV
ncbi:DNA methylase N-4/N-6 [Patescibacteria group bacterium]|nr:DNA methylase N-4/N-6 [Patescibacteria group bacterium]